ncbi:MAG: NAD-dependent epimerase/dehydratase family protein, partial [Vicinamibacterales bacterium]
MRVLVDGDRGYIGAVLAPFVQAAGHEVVGLDVGWYDGCDFGVQPGGYEQRTVDIRDVKPEDLEGFDAVIHLAAISNDPIGHLNPEVTYEVNAHGAVHMAKTAKAAGVSRFLF